MELSTPSANRPDGHLTLQHSHSVVAEECSRPGFLATGVHDRVLAVSFRAPWPVRLFSPRLVLRPLATADHDAWTAGFVSRLPPRNRHDGGPHDPTQTPRPWFRKLCQRHRKLWREDECYILAIFDRHTGRHYGHLDIYVIEREDRQWGNLGYAIHNTAQRRGLATEACSVAIPWAFRVLSLHRLEAVISPDNAGSLGVARKLGLELECTRRSFERVGTEWRDLDVYVAIHGRWKPPSSR
jgi:[ribosomal protein S5]-alanine N-acetyltransferase